MSQGIKLLNSVNFNYINFKGGYKKSDKNTCPDILMSKICPDYLKSIFFSDDNGKEAWAMNLGAIYYTRNAMPVPDKAEDKDREILFSKKPEMARRWTYWVNPKSGTVYIVINKKDNENGTKTVRILDCDGSFIKEADVFPKKIIQIDNFNNSETIDYSSNITFSHGEVVNQHIKRNNPLADVEIINVGDSKAGEINSTLCKAAFKDILLKLQNGEKIDVINCSFGVDLESEQDKDIIFSSEKVKEILKQKFPNDATNEIIPLIEEIIRSGTRVVFAAGNDGENSVSLEFGAKGIDIVGAINKDGNVCDFSSARNFAKHYEKGEYNYNAQKYGINVTEKPGADFTYDGTPYEQFMGKKPEDFLINEDELEEYKKLNTLKEEGKLGRFEYNLKAAKYNNNLFCLKDYNGKFTNIKVDDFSNIYYYPKKSLLLTTDSDGFLIPLLKKQNYCGTSLSAPVRSAKIALNETMYEILE